MAGRRLALGLLVLAAAMPGAAPAQTGKDKGNSPLGALGASSSKDPIKIDADRLDVFDRENKAVFAGNVVAVQGDATIRCSALTVHYKRGKKAEDKKAEDRAEEGAEPSEKNAAMAENGIQKVECAGPVTVKQKDQVATGDSAVFDQVARRIVLSGNVVLSQCQNVTRGSRLVYDMNSGRANMDPGAGGRVSAMFVQGEKADAKGGAKGGAAGCAQPAGVAAGSAPKPPQAENKPPQAQKTAPPARAQAN